jgi:hypothetical protein
MTIDTSIHRRIWDQIPWILNGTLPEEELQAAALHLQTCSDCREELEFQRHIAQSLGGSELTDVDPQRSWQQLRARIEADTPLAAPLRPAGVPTIVPASTGVQAAHPRWMGWLVAATVVQAVGLGVLGTALWSRQATTPATTPAVYRTLSASAPATAPAATIRVVFADDLNIARMQALLNQAGLQVLSGTEQRRRMVARACR